MMKEKEISSYPYPEEICYLECILKTTQITSLIENLLNKNSQKVFATFFFNLAKKKTKEHEYLKESEMDEMEN